MRCLPASAATAYSKVGEIEQEIIRRKNDEPATRRHGSGDFSLATAGAIAAALIWPR
jgi:hypothetical protein